MKKNLRKKIKEFEFRFRSTKSIMTKKYQNNHHLESRSGFGSTLSSTETIRSKIPELLKEFNIRSILDIPCGDFNWFKEINIDSISYIGADIVSEAIERNLQMHSSSNLEFACLDMLEDNLPNVDLVLCRDLFVHFPYKDISRSIQNIKKSGSQYLLTTSFTSKKENKNIKMGQWRPLNLEKDPFFFPKPIKTIDENYSKEGEKYRDKSLCLWKVSNI